uniref:Chemosensory protein n=1 Tax=Semiothisa cinerearia TaxID=2249628 RepID=A0A889XL74_9NEOP|nr:chemosensory protein [Semiothisa cinerearia]
MKTILILCALLAAVACRPEESYSTKYDDFNAQELVDNVRLLKSYAKCFLEHGPCTAEGSDFKKIIPDAVKTKCSKCNLKQRQLVRVVVKAMQQKVPELWQELVKKEDPQGIYKADFELFIKATD